MNIFYFYDKDESDSFKKSAEAQPDKMLVKMPLDYTNEHTGITRVLYGQENLVQIIYGYMNTS